MEKKYTIKLIWFICVFSLINACPHKALPTDKNSYMIKATKDIRPCAPGTEFSQTACACIWSSSNSQKASSSDTKLHSGGNGYEPPLNTAGSNRHDSFLSPSQSLSTDNLFNLPPDSVVGTRLPKGSQVPSNTDSLFDIPPNSLDTIPDFIDENARQTSNSYPIHPRSTPKSVNTGNSNEYQGHQQIGTAIHGGTRVHKSTKGFNPSPYDQKKGTPVVQNPNQGFSFSFEDHLSSVPRNPQVLINAQLPQLGINDRRSNGRRNMHLSEYGSTGPLPPPPPPPRSIEHRQFINHEVLSPSDVDQFRLSPTHISKTKQKQPSQETLSLLKSWFTGDQMSSDNKYVDKYIPGNSPNIGFNQQVNIPVDQGHVGQQNGFTDTSNLFNVPDGTGNVQINSDHLLNVPDNSARIVSKIDKLFTLGNNLGGQGQSWISQQAGTNIDNVGDNGHINPQGTFQGHGNTGNDFSVDTGPNTETFSLNDIVPVDTGDRAGNAPTNTDYLFTPDQTGNVAANVDNPLNTPDNTGNVISKIDKLFTIGNNLGGQGKTGISEQAGTNINNVGDNSHISPHGTFQGHGNSGNVFSVDTGSNTNTFSLNDIVPVDTGDRSGNAPINTDHLFTPDQTGNIAANVDNPLNTPDNTGNVISKIDKLFTIGNNLGGQGKTGISEQAGTNINNAGGNSHINPHGTSQGHGNSGNGFSIDTGSNTETFSLNDIVPVDNGDRTGNVPTNAGHFVNEQDRTGGQTGILHQLGTNFNTVGENDRMSNPRGNSQGHFGTDGVFSVETWPNTNTFSLNDIVPVGTGDRAGNAPTNTDHLFTPDQTGNIAANVDNPLNTPGNTANIVSKIDKLFTLGNNLGGHTRISQQAGTSTNTVGGSDNINPQESIQDNANTDNFFTINSGPSSETFGLNDIVPVTNNGGSGKVPINTDSLFSGHSGSNIETFSLNDIVPLDTSGHVSRQHKGSNSVDSGTSLTPVTNILDTSAAGFTDLNPVDVSTLGGETFDVNDIVPVGDGISGNSGVGSNLNKVKTNLHLSNQQLPDNANTDHLFQLLSGNLENVGPPTGKDDLHGFAPASNGKPGFQNLGGHTSLNNAGSNSQTIKPSHLDALGPNNAHPVDNPSPTDILGPNTGHVNPNEFVPLDNLGAISNVETNNVDNLLSQDPLAGVNDPLAGVNDPLAGINDPLAGISEDELLSLLNGMNLDTFLQTHGIPVDQINPVALKVFQKRIDLAKAQPKKSIGLVKQDKPNAHIPAPQVEKSVNLVETVKPSSAIKLEQKLQRQKERKAARQARKRARAALLAKAKARRKAQREERLAKRKQEQKAKRLARQQAKAERIALGAAKRKQRREQRRRQQAQRAAARKLKKSS